MKRAEDYLGIVNDNLDNDLAAFYKKAHNTIVRARPSMENELKFASKLPMHVLDFETRSELFAEYRKIIRFDKALNNLGKGRTGKVRKGLDNVPQLAGSKMRGNISNIYSRLNMSGNPNSKNPFGRFKETLVDRGSTRKHSLSDIYSNMNIQFRDRIIIDRSGLGSRAAANSGALASHYFTLGLNSIPSENGIKQTKYIPGMLKNKNILTYDVETAGLVHGQIREVAYSNTLNGKKMGEGRLAFTPDEFNRGVVASKYDTKTSIRLREFLLEINPKFNSPLRTSGDEFAEGMRPFLESIMKSDFIVGHNITGFDNEQVFTGLARTRLYRKDPAFEKLVNEAFQKVRDNSIDTMHLVKQMPGLEKITSSAMLSDKSKFSISNLLLQTDLMDHIGGGGGADELAKLMGFDGTDFKLGLHHGSIDTAVTQGILNSQEGQGKGLKFIRGGYKAGSGESAWAGVSKADLLERIRKQIKISSAITPVTHLAVTELTDDILRKAVNDYDNKGILITGSSQEQRELHDLLKKDKDAAYKGLRSGDLTPSSVKISAIQQKILIERNIGEGIDQAAISSGDVIGRIHALRRGKGKEAGIAFSGLSSDEQRIGVGLSKATSRLSSLGGRERATAGLAEDLMVSRYNLFSAHKVQYGTRSGRVSLPAQLIRDAGLFGKNDDFFLSMVEPTDKTTSGAVNVVKSLSDAQAKKLRNFISGGGGKTGIINDDLLLSRALGLIPEDITSPKSLKLAHETIASPEVQDQLARFRLAVNPTQEAIAGGVESILNKIDSKKGVAIGQVFDGDDLGIVEEIGDIFREHFNVTGQVRDDLTSTIRISQMGDIDYENGIIRGAGAVESIGLNPTIKRELGRATEGTREAYEQTTKIFDDRLKFMAAKAVKGSRIATEKVQKIYSSVDSIIPHVGKGLTGLAVVGVGALLLRGHRENQTLDNTLDFQGYEGSAPGQYGIYSQIQDRVDAGYQGYSNQMDPLATASVTSSLNAMKIGHSDYSWNRSNEIYGGIL